MLSSLAFSLYLIILTSNAISNISTSLSPSTSSPTPSTTLPLTTKAFNICSNDKQCKYTILITFDISYSFTDDTHVNNSEFKSIIISTITHILHKWIPNEYNIIIDVTLSITTDAAIRNGKINIDATIGIADDTIYTDINNAYNSDYISDNIMSNLPIDINTIYPNSGFSIQNNIISELSVVHDSTQTNNNNNNQSGLFDFITFDFTYYRLYDWIVFIGFIIFIFLFIFVCCFCCCWCFESNRQSKIPESQMHSKTGLNRISIFRRNNPMNNSEIKQQTSLFKYSNNQASPDQRHINNNENEQQIEQKIYKSNYATSPMKHEWNTAFKAATDNKKLNVVDVSDEDEEDETGGTHKYGRKQGAASLAFSTVSFGKSFAKDNKNDNTKLINEDKEDKYYDYEEEFDHLDANVDSESGGNNANNVKYEAYV